MRKVPLLILHEKVSGKWLETCHEKIEVQLNLIAHVADNVEDIEHVVMRQFILDSYSNIGSKVVPLIEIILKKLRVKGVWKKIFIPDTVEPVTGLNIYGSEVNVKLAINMLSFTLNGLDRYFHRHVKELRDKRRKRRQKGYKLPFEVDARKRTNQNIAVKVKKLQVLIESYIHAGDIDKDDIVFKYIFNHEKLDVRDFRGMIKITPAAVKCRAKVIQLNRVI